jgi:hypothetical protein
MSANLSMRLRTESAVPTTTATPPADSRLSRIPAGQAEELDEVIALFAKAFGRLLKMGLPPDHDQPTSRRDDMGTEPPAVNGHDRYDVLVVEKYEDGAGTEKSHWTRVGVAFPHRDGQGLNVELNALPVSGKLVIRRHEEKTRSGGA